MEEATETHWGFMSYGSIIIEKKEEIKKRIKRSPDWFDSLANTFFPLDYLAVSDEDIAIRFKSCCFIIPVFQFMQLTTYFVEYPHH